MEKQKSQGGSELAYQNLIKYLGEAEFDGINIILNTADPSYIRNGAINILWNQHSFNQPTIMNIGDKAYAEQIDYFVFVSHWQYEKFRYAHKIPESKSAVIKNAIPPIDLVGKPKNIKLIYTSTPWRGLDILLDSFEKINRSDIELDIYSSTIIYGSDYCYQHDSKFIELYDRAKSMGNVNYMGFVPNQSVIGAVQRAHIFAYPCTFEETSCMAAIEAAMAGCLLVTTNIGALPETLAEWGHYVCYDTDRKKLVDKYAEALDRAIDDFWCKANQAKLQDQHQYYRRFWSWDTRITEWRDFLSLVRREKGINRGTPNAD